jgi:UDP-galactopyranose mutase
MDLYKNRVTLAEVQRVLTEKYGEEIKKTRSQRVMEYIERNFKVKKETEGK